MATSSEITAVILTAFSAEGPLVDSFAMVATVPPRPPCHDGGAHRRRSAPDYWRTIEVTDGQTSLFFTPEQLSSLIDQVRLTWAETEAALG